MDDGFPEVWQLALSKTYLDQQCLVKELKWRKVGMWSNNSKNSQVN